jgi:Ca2+-binding EF-hand superfamily protein
MVPIFAEMIDKMVEDSDTDKDGFINYQEYRGSSNRF